MQKLCSFDTLMVQGIKKSGSNSTTIGIIFLIVFVHVRAKTMEDETMALDKRGN